MNPLKHVQCSKAMSQSNLPVAPRDVLTPDIAKVHLQRCSIWRFGAASVLQLAGLVEKGVPQMETAVKMFPACFAGRQTGNVVPSLCYTVYSSSRRENSMSIPLLFPNDSCCFAMLCHALPARTLVPWSQTMAKHRMQLP